jgi:hypothetical protein
MRKTALTIGVFALAILSNSCFFGKAHTVFIPPPPNPQPSRPASALLLPAPPAIDGVPVLPPEIPEMITASIEVIPPADHTAPHRSAPPPARPAPSTPAVEPSAAPPRLTPVLPADTRRTYTRELDESLARVSRALEFLATRNLTADQAADRDKIRTFQKQAEQYREQDLVLAKNLAERADKLAQDLVARVSQ